MNNAYEVLGTAHSQHILSRRRTAVNIGCGASGGPMGGD
jgi:hypothetical protein